MTPRQFHRELERLYITTLDHSGWGPPVIGALHARAAQPGTSRWQQQTCLRYAALHTAVFMRSNWLQQMTRTRWSTSPEVRH